MKEFWKKIWNAIKRICKRLGSKALWCRVGRFCLKVLNVPKWLLVLLVIITVVSLCYIFINRLDTSPLAIVAYGVSAYTFTAVCVVVPSIWKKIRTVAGNSEMVKFVRNHTITQRLVNDKLYRGRIVLYKGMITSMLFAAFKMVVAVIYRSVWFGAVSVYYMALTGMRYLLVSYMKKADNVSEGPSVERFLVENRGYRLCGYLMFFLHIAMSGMTVQMVLYDKGYSYPGYIIYVSAMYAFYTFTMSFVNVFKYRALNSPIISAAKAIGLSSALMSILTLQTAMLAQFGAEQHNFIRLMNSLTGGAVCMAIFVMAIFMICKSGRNIKKQKMLL